MYHELHMQEPCNPMERIKLKALQVIATYGALRWCGAQVCGCMGCANTKMTREEYDLAITMPEVQAELAKMRKPFNQNDLKFYITPDQVQIPDFLK